MYKDEFWKQIERERAAGLSVEEVCKKYNILAATLRRARLAGKLKDKVKLSTKEASEARKVLVDIQDDDLGVLFEGNNRSVSACLRALGMSQSKANIQALKERLSQRGLSIRSFRQATYTKEQFIQACSKVNNLTELTYELGLTVHTANNATFKRLIKEYEIDIGHWQQNCSRRKLSFDEVFCKNSTLPRTMLKQRILQYNILDLSKCSKCGISEWHGEKLGIQVDHIDGDSRNNEIVNLRALCPNCHSLTETYGGKTRK